MSNNASVSSRPSPAAAGDTAHSLQTDGGELKELAGLGVRVATQDVMEATLERQLEAETASQHGAAS